MSKATHATPIEALTPREHEIAKLIMEGLSNKLISGVLGISEYTAKFHVANILTKIGGGLRVKAAVAYARWLDAREREQSTVSQAAPLYIRSC